MRRILFFFGVTCLIASVFADEPATLPAAPRHFKIIQTAKVQYPARMKNEGVSSGVARAVLHVNAEGELVDFLVVAYTRKAFAEEAERTIRQWKFEPEYSGDQPLDTILDITFNFEVTGVLLVQRYGADPLPSTPLENYEYQACSLKYLDRIPTPVAIVRPTYPSEWAEKGIVGQVVVDFYIDETGRTRFAAVPSGANELLAGITVPAVSQWRFSPPTRHGSPVLVHAQQIFDFRKDSAAAK